MAEKPQCEDCRRVLIPDEIGASQLCIGKTTVAFYCLPCLAKRFHTTEDFLKSRIAYLREHGCVLFPK